MNLSRYSSEVIKAYAEFVDTCLESEESFLVAQKYKILKYKREVKQIESKDPILELKGLTPQMYSLVTQAYKDIQKDLSAKVHIIDLILTKQL